MNIFLFEMKGNYGEEFQRCFFDVGVSRSGVECIKERVSEYSLDVSYIYLLSVFSQSSGVRLVADTWLTSTAGAVVCYPAGIPLCPP